MNGVNFLLLGRLGAWSWRKLASPYLMVVFFGLTALGALAAARQLADPTLLMLPPFGLLLVNLGASIASHPRFRADLPLLVFHLALLALLCLFAVGRLTYLHGGVSLHTAGVFAGNLDDEQRGPLHGDAFRQLRFSNEGFRHHYLDTSGNYYTTQNVVHWSDAAGVWHPATIGDDRALILGRYRIYANYRRGFSPIFTWQTAAGQSHTGSVHLTHQSEKGMDFSADWTLPGNLPLWVKLEFAAPSYPSGTVVENLGVDRLSHQLIVRVRDERHLLRPGESLSLPEGTLKYDRLDAWMSYRIIYDPTQPYLIATVLIAVISLGWFYVRKNAGRNVAEEVT